MSYDFWLKVPKPNRRQKKGEGLTPEVVDKPDRARQILQAFEPGIEFRNSSKGFNALSSELGDVMVDSTSIRLSFSMNTQPFVLYKAIHGLLKRFHSEDYLAVDPQIDGDVHYHESFYEFMLQYRDQFNCNDLEFEVWCRGQTPQSWIDEAETLNQGRNAAAAYMPQGYILDWQQQRALGKLCITRFLKI